MMTVRLAFSLLLLQLTACGSMFFQPTREEHHRPESVGYHPDRVTFPSEDGTALSGWYFSARPPAGAPLIGPRTKPKGVIVFFHGNGENISTHFVSLLWILDFGFDFFIFDYRGYGTSGGEPDREGAIADGKAALRWTARNHAGLPRFVLGQSLGGAIAQECLIELKNEIPVKMLVLDSTFSSYRDAAKSVLSQHWLTWWLQPLASLFVSDSLAPQEDIGKLAPLPIIVIHGDHDEVIDFKLGQKLFALAGEPKQFWKVPGGNHIEALWRQEYGIRDRLLEQLEARSNGG